MLLRKRYIHILLLACWSTCGYGYITPKDVGPRPTARALNISEGDPCEVERKSSFCTLVTDCPSAIEAIVKRKGHDYPTCGFDGSTEIVCCPPRESTTDEATTEKAAVRSPVIRKSAQACDEYAPGVPGEVEYQILGGEDAKLGEFPHMAALGFETAGEKELSWDCGGSLISNLYILTAAHCIIAQGRELTKVRLGIISLEAETDEFEFSVKNFTIHPEYNKRTKYNDIALVLLDSRVKYNKNVQPACLYHKSDDPRGAMITGWGDKQAAGSKSTILQKAMVPLMNLTECRRIWESSVLPVNITKTQLCAFYNGTDACQGDSGGPLQVQLKNNSAIYSIVGITSFGRGCGGNFPAIYTRVHSFVDWIEPIVWP